MDRNSRNVAFSSASDEWSTPQEVFDELNKEFEFTLDPCATKENHKCEKYYTAEEDGLQFSWGGTASFAIRHTATLRNGWRNATEKDARITQLLSC